MEQTQETPQATEAQPKAPSKLKGRKLPVKFRGPNGETWAGRGRLPAWMQGQDKEQFRVKTD